MYQDYSDGLIHTTLKGEKVRSRGELKIANLLFKLGLEYEYEVYMEYGKPDFTVKYGGRTFIWEHIGPGMEEQPGYLGSLAFKLGHYRSLSTFEYNIIVTTPKDDIQEVVNEIIMSPNPPREYNSQSELQDVDGKHFDSLPSLSYSHSSLSKGLLKKSFSPTKIFQKYLLDLDLIDSKNIYLLIVEVGGARLVNQYLGDKEKVSKFSHIIFDHSDSRIFQEHREFFRNPKQLDIESITLQLSEVYVLDDKQLLFYNFKYDSWKTFNQPKTNSRSICLYSSRNQEKNKSINLALQQYYSEIPYGGHFSVFFNSLKSTTSYLKNLKPQIHLLIEFEERELSSKEKDSIARSRARRGRPEPPPSSDEFQPYLVKHLKKFDILIPTDPYYIDEVNRSHEEVIKHRKTKQLEQELVRENRRHERNTRNRQVGRSSQRRRKDINSNETIKNETDSGFDFDGFWFDDIL